MAADPELVGQLALVPEEDVEKQLELSDEQIEQLYELLDSREEAALRVASEVEGLDAADRQAKLEPLRARFAARDGEDSLREANGTESPKSPLRGKTNSWQPPILPSLPINPNQTLRNRKVQTKSKRKSRPKHPRTKCLRKVAQFGHEWRLPPTTRTTAKLIFNFRYQPWQDVLDWFAEQSDLSLVLESPPSGTFNYTDRRRYSPAEALDVLNSVLLTKGYTLVRRDRMLVLVNLEDGIPPNLVTDVPLSEL